jgi:YYY domain-containing protein
MVTYVTYLLSHSPALGFRWETVAIASGFLAFLALVRLLRTFEYLVEFVRLRWRLCVAYELIFALAFAAMCLMRMQIPQITYEISDFAAEKFTDFAILNSLLSSRVFPPHDAWVSGFSLNYYYFGHFLWATVARFCSVGSEIAFNLGLASIFAYVLLLGTSLGYNLTAKLRWGFFSAFLIGLSSNLDGALQLLNIAREVWDGDLPASQWYMAYDFWRSSRAIENTINEFPAFSFILGDLHAHLSSLVIFLGGLLLGLQIWRGVRRAGSLLRYELENADELLFLALVFGALYASNSWDVVTFAAYVTALFWSAATTFPNIANVANPPRRKHVLWSASVLTESILLVAILVVVGITVLFRPYWLDFTPPNTRLLRLPAELTSSPVEFLVHWSLLLVPSATLLWLMFRRVYERVGFGPLAGNLTREKIGGLVAAALLVLVMGVLADLGVVAAACIVSLLALSYVMFVCAMPASFRLFFGLLGVFSALAGFSELFYFDDIFTGSIERINTVFKIYYGLWPIAAMAAVFAASRLGRYVQGRSARSRVRVLLAALTVLGVVYPVAGTLQRLGMSVHYQRPKEPDRALDGLRYLARRHPDDYAAILWLRAYAPPDARIVEAPGKQYEYAGRIATNTGRPSIGGWLYHEWGWRGAAFEIERDRRFQVAETIFTSPSLAETARALLRDKFSYVVVGDTERERYPLLNESKFTKLGIEAFRLGHTAVYALYPALLETWATSSDEFAEATTTTLSHENVAPLETTTTTTALQPSDLATSAVEGTGHSPTAQSILTRPGATQTVVLPTEPHTIPETTAPDVETGSHIPRVVDAETTGTSFAHRAPLTRSTDRKSETAPGHAAQPPDDVASSTVSFALSTPEFATSGDSTTRTEQLKGSAGTEQPKDEQTTPTITTTLAKDEHNSE